MDFSKSTWNVLKVCGVILTTFFSIVIDVWNCLSSIAFVWSYTYSFYVPLGSEVNNISFHWREERARRSFTVSPPCLESSPGRMCCWWWVFLPLWPLICVDSLEKNVFVEIFSHTVYFLFICIQLILERRLISASPLAQNVICCYSLIIRFAGLY